MRTAQRLHRRSRPDISARTTITGLQLDTDDIPEPTLAAGQWAQRGSRAQHRRRGGPRAFPTAGPSAVRDRRS